jgi:hypothetical protein
MPDLCGTGRVEGQKKVGREGTAKYAKYAKEGRGELPMPTKPSAGKRMSGEK